MKSFATSDKGSAAGLRKVRPYIHHALNEQQYDQRIQLGRILRTSGAQSKAGIGQANDKYEQEVDRVAEQVVTMADSRLRQKSHAMPYITDRVSTVSSRVQRQSQPEADDSKKTSPQVAEFEEIRAHVEAEREIHFESIGKIIRQHILKAAGFPQGKRPTTAADALKVVKRWGVTLDVLTRGLPQLEKSLSNRVEGEPTDDELKQQAQALFDALKPQGQKTFQSMLKRVRSEPFWRQHIDNSKLYIFPDISGVNRYSGYTQKASYTTKEGLTQPAFIIHISKDRLNNGELEASSATFVHELGHTLHTVNVTARSLETIHQGMAELLADHPDIVKLRHGTDDAQQARQIHIRHIRQILHERTGYAEGEIFSHLQQLTHQPPVKVQGDTIQAHHYILFMVQNYFEQLKRIGMPPRMLAGIERSLKKRVELLYERRIAAAPANSAQRRRLELALAQALATLELAVND